MNHEHSVPAGSQPAAAVASPAGARAEPPVVGRAGAYGLLLVAIATWGVSWPITKIGFTWISPVWFGFGRVMIAAVTLFAVLAALGQLRIPTRRDLPIVLTVGCIQAGVFMVLMHFALNLVDAGRAAILAYTSPLWVVPAAMLFLGERLTRLRAFGLASGLGGIAVLFNPFGFDWSNGGVILGNAMLLGCALCWAIGILHVKVHRWHLTPLQLAPWQMLIGALPSLVAALILEDPGEIEWNLQSVAILAFVGSIATALPFWAMMTLNRALPAISVSLGLLAVPAVGLLSSMVILGEQLTVTLGAGLALILLGVGLVARADRG